MADALVYPYINGFRHDFSSIKLKFQVEDKKIEMFCKSINYGRTRSVGYVLGNHPDPIAQTRGTNTYKGSVEIPLAEYRLLIATIGPGYGDKVFTTLVSYGETGFEVVTDELLGCRIIDDDASNSQGTDPLMRKIELAPLKILMGGIDDLEVPMFSPPAA